MLLLGILPKIQTNKKDLFNRGQNTHGSPRTFEFERNTSRVEQVEIVNSGMLLLIEKMIQKLTYEYSFIRLASPSSSTESVISSANDFNLSVALPIATL